MALLLQVTGAGANFLFCMVVARRLGAEASGIFFLALTVVTVVGILGRTGLENTLLRFTAASVSIGDWKAVKGIYERGFVLAGCVSMVLAGVLYGLAPWLSEHLFSNGALALPLRWMSLSVVPLSLSTLYAHVLRGVKRIPEAVSVLNLWVPLFSLLSFLALSQSPSTQAAAWSHVVGVCLCTMLGAAFWVRATPGLRNIRGHFPLREMVASCMPLLWMTVMQLAIQWSTVLMLGVWRPSSDVAVFTIAQRTANLISFMLYATNNIVAAKFAALFKTGDTDGLRRTAQTSTALMTLAAIPVVALFLAFPTQILHVFGTEFERGTRALLILALGNFINVATGSVSFLLMMCGHEGKMANITALAALANIGLNLLLIPAYGLMGGAVASCLSLTILNLAAVVCAWRKLGILILPVFR